MCFIGREIKAAGGIKEWSLVSVCDNGEPLVSVTSEISPRLKAENKYFVDSLPGTIEGIWVRKSLLPMLKKAAELLPNNISLLVWDAFRPLSVQRLLSERVKMSIEKNNNEILPEAVCNEAAKYATDPDDKKRGIPPHLTGGAVDVCLLDSDGKMLEMGTSLDYAGPEAATDYYKNEKTKCKLQANELAAMTNRCILYDAMTLANFTNYCCEWWHFDFGNQFWGAVCGRKAIYGAGHLPD